MRSSTAARESRARLRATSARALKRPVAVCFTAFFNAFVLLFAQSEGQALRYFKAYFGNFGHVSGAVGLSGLVIQ
jgi:hypothetical protein